MSPIRSALLIIAAIIFYGWTIFGLRSQFLKDEDAYTASEFVDEYPNGKVLAGLHIFFSYVFFVGSMLVGIFWGSILQPEGTDPAYSVWITVAGWNLFNGAFELLSGVSPAYGMIIKRHPLQYYQTGKRVYTLGWLRVGASMLILGLIAWMLSIH